MLLIGLILLYTPIQCIWNKLILANISAGPIYRSISHSDNNQHLRILSSFVKWQKGFCRKRLILVSKSGIVFTIHSKNVSTKPDHWMVLKSRIFKCSTCSSGFNENSFDLLDCRLWTIIYLFLSYCLFNRDNAQHIYCTRYNYKLISIYSSWVEATSDVQVD